MIESASGIFVFGCVDGFWGREAENCIKYLYYDNFEPKKEKSKSTCYNLVPWFYLGPLAT